MRSGYKKFKNKLYRGVFAKSFLCSAGFSLTSAAVVLILGKLNLIEDNLRLASFVLIGAFAVAFILAYAIMAPGAKRAARIVDRELGLGEKAETMHTFKRQRGAMVELQRKETEKLLRKLPLDWYSVKRLWLHAIFFILSLALCSFAYVVPDMPTPPPEEPPEEAFELSEWQRIALENLIDYVEDSELRDTHKAAAADELRSLLDVLVLTKTKREMKAHVVGAIVDINGVIDTASSYDEFADILGQGAAVGIQELSSAIGTPEQPASEESFAALREVFSADKNELYGILLGFGGEVGLCLTRLSLDDDPLADALEGLSDGVFRIIDDISSYDEDGIGAAIDTVLGSFRLSLIAALEEMKTTGEVGAYTVGRLMEIFGITADDLPPEVEEIIPDTPTEDGDENPEDDEESKGESGGFGSGDAVYGSDDTIYYPDEERYAIYGEVINEYYAKITEKILSGELSEELVASLEKYFESLYDGSAKEEE